MAEKLYEVADDCRKFCNGIAMQLPPSNQVIDAIRLLGKELPQFAEHQRKKAVECITVAQNADYTDMDGKVIDTLEPGQLKLIADLQFLLAEAQQGEFGDFTNEKYPTPKLALAEKLFELRENVINGIYD